MSRCAAASSSVRIPPPTVNGMNNCVAVRRTVSSFDAFFEKIIFLPVIEDLLFEVRQAHFVRDLLEHLSNITDEQKVK